MKNKKYLVFHLLFSLIFTSLSSVEERDWINDWPTSVLPGTEEIPSIEVDEIENYSISVTYALDGGRFGDQLTNYLKALWVSWKYKLPLIFRPFEYSDQLSLSDFHSLSYDKQVITSFSAKFGYFDFSDIEKAKKVFAYLNQTINPNDDKKQKLLWNIGLLTPFIEEHFCEKMDDENFRNLLQNVLKPKNELALLTLPKNRKTIAIHVRTGVGYDWEVNIRKMPTKFPPQTFYLRSLRHAVKHFRGKPLYIYIFTDHPEPATIKDQFSKEFASWGYENDVVFDCRTSGNSHSQNVLEDMFSMTLFDCLIHPDSSLSRLAAIIAAHALEMKPSHWGEYRKDQGGNPILDKQGNLIVDPLVIERLEKGKPINHMYLAPIEFNMLFD
jgi:hypothetical protein